ncbi:MAG: hypothetical protein EAY75_06850 [Bacteroidetes bacterium]|nr:MAG: hypothetical protein EAY75_06850 [Bacteroidota bacterium]
MGALVPLLPIRFVYKAKLPRPLAQVALCKNCSKGHQKSGCMLHADKLAGCEPCPNASAGGDAPSGSTLPKWGRITGMSTMFNP